MKYILSFLKDLRNNNDREWFNANKSRYLEVKSRAEGLTERIIAGLSVFDPAVSALRPADCMYRIYRDTRFSYDKTPYKTHIGIFINPHGGKKAHTAGYYLHIEPGASIVAGGAWCPDAEGLSSIRRDIFENVEEYLELINSPSFSKYYKSVGDRLLKTPPKGFPKEWPYIDLLKPRDFTTYTPLSDREMESGLIENKILARMEAVKPFNDFMNFALTGEI